MFNTSDEGAIYPRCSSVNEMDGCAYASRWHLKIKKMIAGLLYIYMIKASPKMRLNELKLHSIIVREERINVHS